MAYDKPDDIKATASIKAAASALRRANKDRLGVVLSGHVRNGKLILDKETLDEIAKKYPDADRAFVAANSPFDPRSLAL